MIGSSITFGGNKPVLNAPSPHWNQRPKLVGEPASQATRLKFGLVQSAKVFWVTPFPSYGQFNNLLDKALSQGILDQNQVERYKVNAPKGEDPTCDSYTLEEGEFPKEWKTLGFETQQKLMRLMADLYSPGPGGIHFDQVEDEIDPKWNDKLVVLGHIYGLLSNQPGYKIKGLDDWIPDPSFPLQGWVIKQQAAGAIPKVRLGYPPQAALDENKAFKNPVPSLYVDYIA